MKPPANTASNPVSDRQVRALLRKLSGPGFTGREDRALAIKQLKSFGCDRAYPALLPLLNHRDLDVRCHAAEAILGIDAQHGLPHVLPLLRARSKTLRWSVCGLLHDFGDRRALAPLIERLQIDRDAQIRGTAAYALGGIGLLQAIPALVQTEQLDHEIDIHGHSPSSTATTAISEILREWALGIVQTNPSLSWRHDCEQEIVAQATITCQSSGEEYDGLPWHAYGATTGCFDPPIKPLHQPP